MRVAFDSRAAKNSTGIARYARCLLEALTAAELGEITETHDPRGADVYHSPWIDGALLRSPIPMVVTLHDVIPLKRRGEYLRSGVRFKMRYLAVQRAVKVIVPTAAVADDAVNFLQLPPERLAIVGEAAASSMAPATPQAVAEVRKRYALPERYLLWVGGLETPDPRKRVTALCRTARSDGVGLVLVGATGHWSRQLKNVTRTGLVSDADLAAIYTGAHAVVFPSDDEGFGLVPVEALACGTPVVASDLPSLREVLGDRATFTPVDDLDALISAAEAARRPAPPPLTVTWADVAAETWSVYEEAVAAEPRWRSGRH